MSDYELFDTALTKVEGIIASTESDAYYCELDFIRNALIRARSLAALQILPDSNNRTQTNA